MNPPLAQHGVKRRDECDAIIERTLSDVGLWDEVADRIFEEPREEATAAYVRGVRG